MLQKPEMKKKAKYQFRPLGATAASPGHSLPNFGERTFIVADIVPVPTVTPFCTRKLESCASLCPEAKPKECSSSLADRSRVQADVTLRHGNESHWRWVFRPREVSHPQGYSSRCTYQARTPAGKERCTRRRRRMELNSGPIRRDV